MTRIAFEAIESRYGTDCPGESWLAATDRISTGSTARNTHARRGGVHDDSRRPDRRQHVTMGAVDPDALAQAITDGAGRLDRIAAVIAGCDPSAPSPSEIMASLDALAVGLDDNSPTSVIRHVFDELGFLGNTTNYYHPSNSLIHQVVKRRIGNPLSLAIVAAELSRRVDGTLSVVGFPGHVLIGDDEHPSRWFDPFLGGAPLDLAGCRSLLARMRPGEAFHPSMVRPATTVEVAQRILNNLDVAYRQAGDVGPLLAVLELRLGLPTSGPGEQRQLAHTLIAAGRPFRAVEVLDELIACDPDNGEDYLLIRQRLLANAN